MITAAIVATTVIAAWLGINVAALLLLLWQSRRVGR
jgi:hypothetical protein